MKKIFGIMVAAAMLTACGGGGGGSDRSAPVSGSSDTWKVVAPSGSGNINITENTVGGTTGTINIYKDNSVIRFNTAFMNSSSQVASPVWSFYFIGMQNSDLLRFPITVGEQWASQGFSGTSTTIVVSKNETVTNPKGLTATNCAHTRETTSRDSSAAGNYWPTTIDRWFCPGYGPFKFVTVFNQGQQSTTYFDTFTPSGAVDPNDYWPMDVGTTWVMKN